MMPMLLFRSLTLSLTLTLGVVAVPAQAQAPSQSAQPTPSLDQSSVPLKAGDRIRVTVAGFPDLSGEQVILQDGTIQLPMAGLIRVGGLSPTQATTTISQSLLPYVRRPQVALSLLSLSPIRISVSGEVLRPGPYSINPSSTPENNFNNSNDSGSYNAIRLSDALVLAGGIKPSADLQNITIRRRGSAGRFNRDVQVNLWQAIQEGNLAADPTLFDGDEILIPVVAAGSMDQRMLLSSTVAPTEITVQVAGEVNNPGQVTISPTSSVSQAVAAAGGPTDKANRRSIELLRMGPDGQLTQQTFEFGDTAETVMNGDLIVVRKRGTDSVLDFLGRLLPFSFLF
ncbi:SLBB domain-containing protein [Leptolyngbya sp. AN02str]|uniref:SLBB domain-containing protein n=1 Tax=Leptolyngbya sp. AN02str TaxID=3423363 RepID=UPI003D320EE7